MTPIIWTIMYIFLVVMAITKGGIDAGKQMGGEYTSSAAWIVSIVAAFVIFIPLYIMYLAGIFVDTLGYEGTPGWYATWIVLVFLGFAKVIYDAKSKKNYGQLIAVALSYICLLGMGAFDKF